VKSGLRRHPVSLRPSFLNCRFFHNFTKPEHCGTTVKLRQRGRSISFDKIVVAVEPLTGYEHDRCAVPKSPRLAFSTSSRPDNHPGSGAETCS
jgi:hypothetical protein